MSCGRTMPNMAGRGPSLGLGVECLLEGFVRAGGIR